MQNGSPILKKDLRSVQENGEPEIHERVDLRAWTALGVGGLADLLIRCRSADGLQRALDLLAAHGQPWLVLGAGSRLVPPDRGLRVPVLNLSGGLGLWELDLDGAVAGGGANMAQLCRAASRTGLTGAENFITTGSSIGGAVHAAANGQGRFAKPLDWVEVARPGRPVERIQLSERGDRRTGLDLDLHRRVIARARFQLVDERTRPAPGKGAYLARNRVQRQLRSAEPLFVDPAGARAGPLLIDAECVDMKIGGARLSSQQANRVCTSKTARASDVLELARLVRERVLKKDDVALEPALCFVDEDGRKVDL